MNREMRERCFPLSLSQQNILNLEHALAGTSVNNISTTVRICGRLDFPVLQQSIHHVLESDSSLRTAMTEVDGAMMQYHFDYVREEFPVFDFTNTSKEGFENWESAVTRELIPLTGGALYRFILFRDAENSGGVLVKLHHIIADGWSQIMLCNKIGKTYLELLAGKEPSLEVAPDYELHVKEEQDYLSSKAFGRDERYWKKVLEQSGEPSVLKSVNSAAVSPVGRRVSFELPQILNHAIYSFCQEKRVAPFAVFYMALAIYFKRIGGADKFTIGVPIFNRTNYEFKQSTGMFVTTLPFYQEINDEWTLNQFNDELMENWYEMLRHQRYPFSKITELTGGDDRLFHIALSYQDSRIYESRDASVHLSGRWHYSGYQAEQLTIHLTNLKNHQQYAVDYDYLAQFFAEEEISALHRNLCHILSEALTEPDRPIHRLNVLTLEEKEQVLYTFNQTDRYLEERSVYEALVQKSKRYPNRAALICSGERMTYGALLHRSAQFAVALSERIKKKDALVAILLPRKFDLPAAMIGSLQAGYAYMILSEELPTERIRYILKQSEAAVLVTDERGKQRMDGSRVKILCTDEVDECLGILYQRPEEDTDFPGDKLAYVVYTSGSTGEPKGVEITQRNLLNLAQEMEQVYGQGAVLSVCNVGFDAFMLESIVALLNGKTIVFPEESDLEFPERLAALMNGYAVGFFSMTPSRLSVYLQNSTFHKVMWRMESIVCGGEFFPTELLKKLKTCTNARIYNQYGPSETAVAVSMKELSHADKITAGVPMGNCRLYVLDQWMNPLPIGGNGRLFIGGKCVGRGYRKRPDLTEKVFRANPFASEDRIYDTGDLAFWTPGGEIVLTGRADSQVKLRGLRIELQEVASCVESFPGVTAAHAGICEVNGQPILGVYYCAKTAINEAELLSHTATYLPRYMIPAFLIRMDQLPMTANGKVDEKRLPLPANTAGDVCGMLSTTAKTILDIFCRVLKQDELYGNSDYFLAGGNSLNAMECVMEIENRLGRKVRIEDIYACRTAVRLAAFLEGDVLSLPAVNAVSHGKKSLKKSPERLDYALTPVQQGMYIQWILDPEGFTYNMPGAFKLEKAPDRERLESAFLALIYGDEIFRTCFVQRDGQIRACVQDKVSFELETLIADSFEEASGAFLRPFDLAKAPLLRAALWQSPDGEWYLFVDSHHIIGDGMSTPLILKRLDQAYVDGRAEADWTFYDYLYTEELEREEKSELEYWVSHLKEVPEPLVLPGDFVRPKSFDFKGKEMEITLSREEGAALTQFAKKQGVSEYVLFLAAFGVLLAAISGREDFVIGAPVAGRTLPDASKICGPFINTLPLRLRPEQSMSVSNWVKRVQEEVAGMLDHQQISLEEIIRALDLPRQEQNALYQIMLTQSPVDEDAFCLDGGKMVYRPISTGNVKMDMILELTRKSDSYALRFSYASGVFAAQTIAFYGRCMRQILSEIVGDIERPLHQLTLLSAEDYEKFVEIPNFSVTPFVNRPVHKILQSRIRAMGTETAIIFHGEKVTFDQLGRRAAAIAAFIAKKGLKPGQCVGLCLRRTPEMIAAMLGVLKAGCAYMFMLDNFPEARLRYMLEISEAGLLLVDENTKESLPDSFIAGELPCEACLLPEGEVEYYQDRQVNDDQLVNVLFTSGSTGKPKGVMLRHRSVSNLYAQMKTLLAPIEGNVLCSTNAVFDCFVVETLIALALGRTVVLADEEEMMLPWKLADLIETYQTSVFEMTPSRLQMCLGNEAFCRAAKHIGIVLLGGEVVTKTLLEKFYEHSEGKLMNMYGPTEATVFTTMCHLKSGEHITIGKPLQNTRTYVLDEKMRPVLPTACGEMYIAGECLAAGYISRPELTESSFVEDIYFPEQKMYRSGDLVRLRVDGGYDYIGRKDAQVKLNGQRVELGEITGAILETGDVKQAAVVPVRKQDGSMELCAFCVPENDRVTEDEIFAKAGKTLPVYMIPSRLMMLSQMPMTATNKIDMQTLKQMAQESEGTADKEIKTQVIDRAEVEVKEVYLEEPAGSGKAPDEVNEAYILSVWNRVLSVPAANENESFFKLGGTSMAALTVLSHYYNDRLEMSLAEFYEHPTASAQARLLRERSTDSTVSQPAIEKEKKEVNGQKSILVTGATGFFGVHLVSELIAAGASQVVCLMRDGDEQRLRDCLAWYYDKTEADRMMGHIEVIKGDIAGDRLGLSERAYHELAACVGEIYHCAADVRHYAADEENYLATNVAGTENMLALAKAAGAAFYHMSTLSVSGDRLKDGRKNAVFTEADYDIGQNWESNIYVKSKFLAEGLVFKAMQDGLCAKIFRLGRLVGRECDGKFQKNPETNAFYLLMKGFCQIGAIPKEAADMPMDLMPIDVCAKEVLALKGSAERVFHIMHSNPPTLGEVMIALDEKNRIVENEEFGDVFRDNCQKLDRELWALVMNYWRGAGISGQMIVVDNGKTAAELAVAGYEPKITVATVLKEFWKGE